ncbi:MAG: hypothetical protein ABL886_08700 [Rhodoglobus sp.]
MIVRRLIPALLVVTAAVFLALAEIQRLAGQTVSTIGTTFSLGSVSGPTALSNTAQWSGWTTISNPAGFIRGHTLLDLALFIPLYAVLFGIAIWRTLPDPASSDHAAALTRRRRLFITLGALVVVDIVEDTMLLIACSQLDNGAPVSGAVFQAVVSTAKWVAMAVLIVGVIRAPVARTAIGTWFRNGRAAVHAQRLSAIVVLVLGILSLVPATEVLEQLPDVERAWFDDLWLGAGPGLLHGVFAAAAITGVAITFFVIGRKRAELYYRMLVLGEDSTGLPRTYSDTQTWRM